MQRHRSPEAGAPLQVQACQLDCRGLNINNRVYGDDICFASRMMPPCYIVLVSMSFSAHLCWILGLGVHPFAHGMHFCPNVYGTWMFQCYSYLDLTTNNIHCHVSRGCEARQGTRSHPSQNISKQVSCGPWRPAKCSAHCWVKKRSKSWSMSGVRKGQETPGAAPDIA